MKIYFIFVDIQNEEVAHFILQICQFVFSLIRHKFGILQTTFDTFSAHMPKKIRISFIMILNEMIGKID